MVKYIQILIFAIMIFTGCTSRPKVVVSGDAKYYELGGREPCIDLIVKRNSIAKTISNDAIRIKEENRLLIFKKWYKKLSPLDGSDAVKRCKFTDGSINYHGKTLKCHNYKKLVVESNKCLAQDSSILVNPFVNLRTESKK